MIDKKTKDALLFFKSNANMYANEVSIAIEKENSNAVIGYFIKQHKFFYNSYILAYANQFDFKFQIQK